MTLTLRHPLARVLLALVLLLGLLSLRVLVPTEPFSGLDGLARDFFTLGISVFVESFPFVVLGVMISALVTIWLPPQMLGRLLPRRPVLRRAVMSLLGILMPVCECGNVPMSRGLLQRGFTVGEALTFLLAAPILNPVTILTTYHAFGFDDGILIARILGGFLIANLIGWIFSRHPAPDTLLTERFAASCAVGGTAATGSRWRRTLDQFGSEMTVMLPALMFGAAVAALIQVGVPRALLVELGANPVWSVVALLGLAFVVSLCSNVDAFFILALSGLFLPGGVVAFLVFGAMIDVKMLALLRTTFRTRTLVITTAVAALATAAIGFGVNLIV